MREIRLAAPVRLVAPAKINLGLEVVRRRPDGYHDIVTVFQSVSLFDVIVLRPADRFEFCGDPRVPAEEDLTLKAIRSTRHRLDIDLKAEVIVLKRIPIAAGLGGGSSDAGALLSTMWSLAGADLQLAETVAADLGSDVPFFIHGGTALATSTGIQLERLPESKRKWFVVTTPQARFSRKTESLYRSLEPTDFSDGTATTELASSLRQGKSIDARLMRNAFARPLYDVPAIANAKRALLGAGASFVLPCGAGPSLFTIAESWGKACDVARRMRSTGFDANIYTNLAADINSGRLAPDAARRNDR